MKHSTLYRINKLNSLLILSVSIFEQAYTEDQKDITGEFNDELRAILKGSEDLQNRVMKEIEKLRSTINKQ